VLSPGATLRSVDILLPILQGASASKSFKDLKTQVVIQFERTYIQQLILTYQGNITRAAQAAGKDRRAFWQLIRKHHMLASGTAQTATPNSASQELQPPGVNTYLRL